ncbi:Receptor homology region transmembrane domain- and RING domain-containing protein 1 [Zea mays]|uniref:Receptor homology region transmembrane domain-and RING domain-containing protein 1 n=2 Tax=Zea mays TaxID=4577 RepID=A0A1D6J4M1_MAIZE|nr:Receptor homology region transmembrane domain- and RING domain-containing protein 1 [Zea mays]
MSFYEPSKERSRETVFHVPAMSPRVVLLFLAALRPCAALVRLHSTTFSFTFLDAPARFGPRVSGDGICGSLRAADPAEACETIKDRGGRRGAGRKAFVLIARGNCSFEEKVRAAQQAGFDASIVYDDEEKASLYSNSIDDGSVYAYTSV